MLASEPGWSTLGKLSERDGLPLLVQGDEVVKGHLIRFTSAQSAEAYTTINSIEPDKLYLWKTALVIKREREESANVLFGRKPGRGAAAAEYKVWDGRKDPLYTAALDGVRRTLESHPQYQLDLEPFGHRPRAYLLLWCSIERFVSFKYHLGLNATEKVFKLAEDPVFARALQERIGSGSGREVFRSDDPEKKEVLDPNNPRRALGYYYQIRSNVTHRGKTAIRDHEMLLASVTELLDIFSTVLHAEFSDLTAPEASRVSGPTRTP